MLTADKYLFCPKCNIYPDEIINTYTVPITEKRKWDGRGDYELVESNQSEADYEERCGECNTPLVFKLKQKPFKMKTMNGKTVDIQLKNLHEDKGKLSLFLDGRNIASFDTYHLTPEAKQLIEDILEYQDGKNPENTPEIINIVKEKDEYDIYIDGWHITGFDKENTSYFFVRRLFKRLFS